MADVPAIAHGCNCAGVMGGGIAVEFRRRWPAMYHEYRERCRAGTFRVGDVFTWPTSRQTIFNLATQSVPGPHATLVGIRAATLRMATEAAARGIDAVGLPRIGAGLGGLKWAEVKAVLDEIADEGDLRLIVFIPPGATLVDD